MTAKKRPRLFIGSSSEGKAVAEAVDELLADDADITLWTDAFTLGKTFSESLVKQLDISDFAVLIMTADDSTRSRKKQSPSPRDNVVFELGLFTGRIGFDRCYCVHPDMKELKFPSDLMGITSATYRPDHPSGLTSALRPACNKIRGRFAELGIREKTAANAVSHQNLLDFCSRIAGHWWEFIKPVRISALGFLNITFDKATAEIHVEGLAHRPDGTRSADWETVVCGIGLQERKFLYMWKGRYFNRPDKLFEGFGDFTFYESNGIFLRGHGVFAEVDATDLKRAQKKMGKIVRCKPAEIAAMESGDKKRIAELVRSKYKER